MLKKFLLSLLPLITSCQTVEIPNTTKCAVAGVMGAGMICAETMTDKKYDKTLDETIVFLESGAICQSADDFNKEKTALEQACRLLGKRCSLEAKQYLSKVDQISRIGFSRLPVGGNETQSQHHDK